MRRTLLLGFLLFCLGLGFPVETLAQDEPVVDWLRAHAVPLATAEAESGFQDLEPLREIVGDARIVLLGEATHGTREFYQLKHRILEFLASEMGFSVLAAETFWAGALGVNAYVLHGQGTATEALAALSRWRLDTHEVLAMIRWMRRHNQDPRNRRKIKFYGFDMQDGWSSMDALKEYFGQVDPRYTTRVEEVFAPLEKLDSYETVQAYSDSPAEELAATSEGIAEILQRLDDGKVDYVAKSSTEEWGIALQHARIVSQAEETWRQPEWPETGGLREHFMAENVESIFENEGAGARMVVSAHNGHVTKGLWMGSEMMGGQLKRSFGAGAVVFGFAFNEGSFQAWNRDATAVVEHTVGPAPEGSVSATLTKVRLPLFLVDLRQAPTSGPLADWLSSEHPERTVGSQFNPEWDPVQIAPSGHYDVLVFVEKTTRARPTPTGVMDREQ